MSFNFDSKLRKFTFRCEICKTILSSEFDDERDIEDIKNNQLWLECPCEGRAYLLTD